MATYIKGVTDYIPALEPFKPDYKFLSDVLSVRQDRYDTNYKQLNDLYSKIVYAPLSRADNEEKRGQYANRLSNGLKQVSGLDLSLQQNVDVAKGLFKPFFEDKSLIKDMAATKLYAKENQRANSYLNSNDKEISRQYWDTGVQGLSMWMDKFKNASAEEALTMGMPQYVPNPDLYNTAFNSLKDSGLKIKQTTLDGDWIVTTENGTALTRQITGYKRDPETKELIIDPKTEQPIPIYSNPAAEHLMNTVMQDPQIKRAYLLEAQVKEWQWMKENEKSYGSVNEAKKAWAMEIIEKYANEETKKLVENEAQYKLESIANRNWEQWKKHNKIEPGSPEEEALALVAYNNFIAKSNRDATQDRLKDLKGPKSDIGSLMSTAYSAYMGFHMSPKMNAAAVAYSQIDASQTFEANPFKKMERQHQFDLNKMAIQHGYDMDKIYAKAKADIALKELELSGSGNQNLLGIGGVITGEGDSSISGSLYGMDLDGDGEISRSEMSFIDGIEENKKDTKIFLAKQAKNNMDFIEEFTTQFPEDSKGIRGYQGSGQFEYTYYPDALNGQPTTKTGSIDQMVNDLSNMDSKYAQLNNTELDAVIDNFISVYHSKIETKDGSVVSYMLPTENTKPGSSVALGLLYDNVIEGRTALTDAFLEQNRIYNNVNNRVMAENTATKQGSYYQGQDFSIPSLFLTQGEIDMLNQGVPYYKVKHASENGKLEEPIKDSSGKAVRRFVTEDEFIEIYKNMVSLTNDQRNQLKAPGHSSDRDRYDFFLKEPGTFNDWEYLAEKYWSYRSPTKARNLNTGKDAMILGHHPVPATEGRWVFDGESAEADAKDYYKKFRNNMNAVMGGANAPDVDLNFSIRSYMQGQPQLGLGETNYNIYTTTYDVASKTATALNQIKELTNVFYGTPKQDLMVTLGDNRTLTSAQQMEIGNQDLARSLTDAILQQINTGYNDKTQKRSFVTTSYVEKSGGPDQPEGEEIFSMHIKPGPLHADVYKGMFGDMTKEANKKLYAQFMAQGITISAPQKYDTNPYKSTNVMMSYVERIIRNEGVYNSPFVQNGGEFSIYKNTKGQYIQEYTSYGVQEIDGVKVIVPDATQTTPLNIVDPAMLDLHKMGLMEQLNIIAKNNINTKK